MVGEVLLTAQQTQIRRYIYRGAEDLNRICKELYSIREKVIIARSMTMEDLNEA